SARRIAPRSDLPDCLPHSLGLQQAGSLVFSAFTYSGQNARKGHPLSPQAWSTIKPYLTRLFPIISTISNPYLIPPISMSFFDNFCYTNRTPVANSLSPGGGIM